MGWVIIKRTENLSTEQLKELKEREPFEGKNLIQIKKILENDSCKIGPEPKEMAAGLTIPSFNLIGIEAEFVPLNDEEKQNMLNEIEIPDY